MYGLADIRKAVKNPQLIPREINGLVSRGFQSKSYNKRGVDIFSQDWDNLIILDACRYDTFKLCSNLPGRLESRQSRGSATPEFIEGNFIGREHYDTVYVTGNSWIFKKNADKNLHLVYDVIKPEREDGDNIDKPTLITQCAKEAFREHPDKRIIVHFIRPHQPFIGEEAQSYFEPQKDVPPNIYPYSSSDEFNVSEELIRKFYEENLRLVLPKVEELLSVAEGKTVVTSDHGELLGERTWPLPIKTFGHPRGLHIDSLLKVPWLVYQNGDRREIKKDPPVSEPDRSYAQTDTSVDERLRNLGYKV